MIVSALDSAASAEKYGLRPDQIILSAKVSGVQDLIDVYRALAARCNYPLHLGLTEAGMGAKGVVASSAAMGVVLQEGSATRSASHLPRPPAATAPKKCESHNRFCNPWAFAALRRKSPPAPAADAPPAPSSRRWLSRFSRISASRCLHGRAAMSASKR